MSVSPSKSHAHDVGPPPDWSVKATVSGCVPLVGTALNAAFGTIGVAPPVTDMPVLIGKADSAEAWTTLPRIAEMTGVITPKLQVSPTTAVPPIVVPLGNVGGGTTG